MITNDEVLEFQYKWGAGIVRISNAYKNGGDYISEANNFIGELYAYGNHEVLFKPTLARDVQFRLNRLSALSYFIGGNPDFPEDEGFAIKGWDNVRWDNAGVHTSEDYAISMGNYYFMKHNENDLKVEYSIVLKKIKGSLRMILHDSHLPYQK